MDKWVRSLDEDLATAGLTVIFIELAEQMFGALNFSCDGLLEAPNLVSRMGLMSMVSQSIKGKGYLCHVQGASDSLGLQGMSSFWTYT